MDANIKTKIDGVEYVVKFKITYETITEDRASELAKDNKSLRNNFIRVEDGMNEKSSFSLVQSVQEDNVGGNSFWFNTDDELGSSTTPAHEYGHGLGLDHFITTSESEGRPNIMIPRKSDYGKYWSTFDQEGKRIVNPNSRRVSNKNILDAILKNGGKIHNKIFNKDGTY